MRIGVIEDNIEVQNHISRLIESWDKKCEIVYKGESVSDAVELFNRDDIDLAILDINLKEGLVFDALDRTNDVKCDILFSSSYGDHALRAFKYSAINFFLKPIEAEKLYEGLNKVFSKRILKKHSRDQTTS